MTDSIITYSTLSVTDIQIPTEIQQVLSHFTSTNSRQEALANTLLQVRDHFWKNLITLGDTKVFHNSRQRYQIEWSLLDERAKPIGTLVFGRKLPTVYGWTLLTKFWIRHRNFKFGDLTVSPFAAMPFYDHPYFHDYGEALRLNRYSKGEGDTVYRHESDDGKNPNWTPTVPCSRRQPLFGSDRGVISISDDFDDPIDDLED